MQGEAAIQIDRLDSPIGRWLLARSCPPALAEVVEGIWYFEGTLTCLRERHFPHGLLDLIVHLGPAYRSVQGANVEPFSRTCIAGLQLGPDVVEAPPCFVAVLGVRLKPIGAYRILGLPLSELTSLTVDLEDVAGAAARELAERCEAAANPEARLQAAAAWLEARTQAGHAADAAVCWAVHELDRRGGALPIATLRDRIGWSKTRFTAAFRQQTGVAPKTLARIYRFRNALGMLTRADRPLSEIAFAAGYYDQPHFNAEFRELAGFTPVEYRTLARFPDSTSVAER